MCLLLRSAGARSNFGDWYPFLALPSRGKETWECSSCTTCWGLPLLPAAAILKPSIQEKWGHDSAWHTRSGFNRMFMNVLHESAWCIHISLELFVSTTLPSCEVRSSISFGVEVWSSRLQYLSHRHCTRLPPWRMARSIGRLATASFTHCALGAVLRAFLGGGSFADWSVRSWSVVPSVS